MSVTFCRFGRNVRLVLLLAWETLFPTCRPLPVSSQTRDIVSILIFVCGPMARRAPPVSRSRFVRQRRGPSRSNPTAVFALEMLELKVKSMRAILLVLILAILLVIAGIATGFLN